MMWGPAGRWHGPVRSTRATTRPERGRAPQVAVPAISRSLPTHQRTMIDSFARVSGWQQLYHLWELIVMLCKFLWGLLRLLGGG
jgi:hypothetical protein